MVNFSQLSKKKEKKSYLYLLLGNSFSLIHTLFQDHNLVFFMGPFLQFFSNCSFDFLINLNIILTDHCDTFSRSTRTCRTANPMNVVLAICRPKEEGRALTLCFVEKKKFPFSKRLGASVQRSHIPMNLSMILRLSINLINMHLSVGLGWCAPIRVRCCKKKIAKMHNQKLSNLHIIIYDTINMGNIEATSSYIRTNKYTSRFCFKST